MTFHFVSTRLALACDALALESAAALVGATGGWCASATKRAGLADNLARLKANQEALDGLREALDRNKVGDYERFRSEVRKLK